MESTPQDKPKRSFKVTLEHQGDIGDYETPTIAVKGGGKIHPDNCMCKCTSEAGGGSGNGTISAE